MKKQLLLLVVLCLTAVQAWGQTVVASGTCGAEGDGSNLTWTLTDGGTLTISGEGAMENYYYYYDIQGGRTDAPWFDLRENVKTVIMESHVTSIGNYAYYQCDSLVSVSIPNTVTNIGNSAFSDCRLIVEITMPQGVKNIGEFAFAGCFSLANVSLPSSVVSIGKAAFRNCRLTSISIPDGVTSIEDDTFRSSSLTSIIIPNSVTSIGQCAFYCCPLPSIVIPEGVTTIKESAFEYCFSLTSVTIPNSMADLKDYAFFGCEGLETMTVHAITPPNSSLYAFGGVDRNISLYVPAESVEAYRAASVWNEFNHIYPIEGSGIAMPSLQESITVQDGEVHINMAGIDAVQVYDLQGHQVLRTTERHFALPQGIYIIKVGDEAIPLIP